MARRAGDWGNSAYAIYRDVAGTDIEPAKGDLGAFGNMEEEELARACDAHSMPYELLARSLQLEFDMQGMTRRQKIHGELSKILSEEWRGDMSEAVADAAEKKRKMEAVRE